MSAILAVFNRRGEPADPRVAQAMLAASPGRIVDGQRTWANGPIALAHAHFWITPEELNEEQPLLDDSGYCAIAADVRLDNRKSLIEELGNGDAGRERISDAQLLLRAYRKWGTECAGHLLGEFALVIWDSAAERIFVARDALGSRGLCYYIDSERCLVASEIKQLLAHPMLRARLNEGKVADFLAGLSDEHEETFYEGILYCAPAHCMVVSAESVRKWRYWDINPEARIRYRTDREYAEHFRELFSESVRSRLRCTGPVAVSLSGGLDSTSVAAVASRQLSRSGLPGAGIMSLSYVFDEYTSCDERRYIQPLVDRYGISATFIPGDDKWTLRNLPDWPGDRDFVFSDAYVWLTMSVIEAAQRNGCRVLLGGQFGDALFQGGEFWAADLLNEFKLGRLLAEVSLGGQMVSLRDDLINHGFRQLFSPRLKRAYRRWRPQPAQWSNPGLHPDLARRTSLQERAVRDDSWRRFSRPGQWQRYRILTENSTAEGGAAMRNRYTVHSVQQADPFFDRRLIEFAMAVPADQLGRPYRTKWVLRNAMADLLPEEICHRVGKTSFEALWKRGIHTEERGAVERILRDPQIVLRNLICADWLHRKLYSDESRSDDDYWLWLCISLELWLDRYW